MKRFFALTLVLVLILSLAACGEKTDTTTAAPEEQETIADALTLMNTVWASYGEEDLFPAAGGDFSEENMSMDGPGKYDVADAAALDSNFGLPESCAAKVDGAASLMHMMNANTFTGAAFHVTKAEDVTEVANQILANLQGRQWICGMPDVISIASVEHYVVVVFGEEGLVSTFMSKLGAAYPNTITVAQEAVSVG